MTTAAQPDPAKMTAYKYLAIQRCAFVISLRSPGYHQAELTIE
jgi:hypothetical protein